MSLSSTRPLLLLAALLLCAICVAQGHRRDDDANTLRLCGRAFVRAVVFTCGGSRWRRLTGGEDAQPKGTQEPHTLTATDFPSMSRRWRDQNQALKTVCCELGCQKSDLSMLC